MQAIPDADLGDQLHEAVQHIGGHYEAQELAPEEELSLQGETIPADPNVKNFSYAVVDGDVYFRENSIMRKADLSATATGRIKGMVELRTIVQELIDYQLNDYPEDAIAQKQRELNLAYDRFADQSGPMTDSPISMDLSIPVQMHRLFRKIRLIICFALWKM